jgi:protein-L-isoaspartate(D-aspartate) O-methyltransferase
VSDHPVPAQVAAAERAGVRDPRVLAALNAVPRTPFVPGRGRPRDVDRDQPLSIGEGQTTSQPSLVATMLEALELRGHERVLEIGTGTGYEAALLSHLAAQVHTIERIPRLAELARRNLADLGISNVEVVVGDGTRGLPDRAPFDAVIVAAATDTLPTALAGQVVPGGRVVAPLGPRDLQQVVVHEQREGRLEVLRRTTRVRFVPLVADVDPEPHPGGRGCGEDPCP